MLRTLDILRSEAAHSRCAVLASLHDLSQVGAFDRVLLVDHGEVVADTMPAEIFDLPQLARAFRIEKAGKGWKVSEKA